MFVSLFFFISFHSLFIYLFILCSFVKVQVDEMKTKLEQAQSALTKAEAQFKTIQSTMENADKELRKT